MINIAIDGFGGSGKSTLSKGLAARLGFKVLDTGALYRGFACEYKARKLGEPNEKIMHDFVKNADVQIFFEGQLQHVVVNGHDHTSRLRTEEISVLSAKISPFKQLREKVKKLQRDFAQNNDCVIEGRDIGSEVLPNADVKIFITASPEIRAQRRFDQIKDKPYAPTFEEILEDLNKRDYADVHRAVSPLVPAKDAVVIDTTNLTLDESLVYCEELIKNTLRNKRLACDGVKNATLSERAE